MTLQSNHCWVIHDGAVGNRRQALALVEALAWPFEEKVIKSGGLGKWLAPRILPFVKHPFGNDFAQAMHNPPAYVIGCGRQAALATRLMKQIGSTAIQILNPQMSTQHWDVVIAPTHDQLRGDNVITCVGSLHNVNAAALNHWGSQPLPRQTTAFPCTAVLIGGPSRMALFNEGLIEVMFGHLEYELAKHGGSLIVCGSRRTPKPVAQKIRQRFSDSNFPVWFDDGDGENPYRSLLANADRIVLTPDSVNMISEACASKLPVYIAQPERATGRMKIFLSHLLKIGRIRPLSKEITPFPALPLSTMPDVLEQLKRLLP
jgi:uncharacterized protein